MIWQVEVRGCVRDWLSLRVALNFIPIDRLYYVLYEHELYRSAYAFCLGLGWVCINLHSQIGVHCKTYLLVERIMDTN